jgi:hypothetical protein
LVTGGSLVPGAGTVVLADAILTPTLEPSLLSSQIQQRPGHPQTAGTYRYVQAERHEVAVEGMDRYLRA